jgi:hypothetical protein
VSGQEQAISLTASGPATGKYDTRLVRLVDLVRRQWVIAANPASRAGFERRVEGAIYGRINEIMRKGREDKDVIRRLEHLLDQQQAEHRHTLDRVRAVPEVGL